MTEKSRLCIVSPYSYPLFNQEKRRSHFGGWEVRTSLIAKELARRGHFEVSMIVWDHGQPHIEQRDGVTLYAWTGKLAPEPSSSDVQGEGLEDVVTEVVETPMRADVAGFAPPPAMTALDSPETLLPQRFSLKRWLRSHLSWRVWLLLRLVRKSIVEVRSILWRGGREALVALYTGFYEFLTPLQPLWRGGRGAIRALSRCLLEVLRTMVRNLRTTFRVMRHGFDQIEDYVIWKDAVAIYDEVAADIYLVPGNHNRAAEVAWYCRQRGKKYVFLAGSNIDYNPAYKTHPWQLDLYGIPGYLMAYAIENAALHIAQNDYQAVLLQQGYGRTATVIRNPIDTAPLFPRQAQAISLLWVGSADDRVKRPDLILDLACRLPEYTFVVLLVPGIPEVYQRCRERARRLANVIMVGRTPFHEVEQYFANARLFVNTSAFEGFPNTFLQAAKYGVPIVAARVDPGDMLLRHGCGLTCNDNFDVFEKNVCLLMTDQRLYAETSACCLEYVRTYHDKARIIPQYETALMALLS